MPKAVIVSEAKQSSPLPALLDCFVASLLAMTPLTMSRHPRDLVYGSTCGFMQMLKAANHENHRKTAADVNAVTPRTVRLRHVATPGPAASRRRK